MHVMPGTPSSKRRYVVAMWFLLLITSTLGQDESRDNASSREERWAQAENDLCEISSTCLIAGAQSAEASPLIL